MPGDSGHVSCAKKIELLLKTREEDFKELCARMAEMQRLQAGKVEALAARVAVLEESLARFRHNPRCMST
jgi:uncharacterized protein involved in tolerance to divalent cations